MVKKVTILGSTGSIGNSALDVIRQFRDRFEVTALAAGSNVKLLAEQIRDFKPQLAGIYDEGAYNKLKSEFPSVTIVAGEEGIREVASYAETDIILSAIVGAAGLAPTLDAVKT